MDTNNGTTMLVQPAGYGGGYPMMGGIGNGLFGGWGGNGLEALIFLVVIAAMFGFGGNGWGGGGNNSVGDAAALMALSNSGAQPNYVLTSDFASVERKMDLIQAQLCDGLAGQNALAYTNNANVIDNLHTGFAAAELSAANQMTALTGQIYNQNMQNLRQNCDLTHQVSDGFAQVGYQMAQQGCETRQAICTSTRDIIDSQTAGTRAILDRLTQSEMAQLRDQNADLRAQIYNANLVASQAAQTEALKGYVSGQFAYYNPRPVPSFPVAPPYQFGGLGYAA